MAVDLATSGSLGYGIGLQGKVPDKSNLVLQLENQRLKRQALKGQEEEEKQKKEEKQLNLLAKGLNVDATKWHRTLVPTVQKYANDAMEEFYRLSKTNKNLAVNSIPQIMRSFEEKVSPLYTTNDYRKNFQKNITQKIINQERIPNDMLQFNQYLNMGDDASLDKTWESDLGIYKVTPNSIVTETVMPKSTAVEEAKTAAKSVGTDRYIDVPDGVNVVKEYDDASVLGYMNQRYAGDQQKKLSDIAEIEPNLRKVWKESGLESQGVTFRKFTTDPTYSKDIENELLKYNKSLLAGNAPAAGFKKIVVEDEIGGLAQRLLQGQIATPGSKYITTIKDIPQKNIDDAWDVYKNTDLGAIVIRKAGGEREGRKMYESFLRQKIKSISPVYQPSAAEKAKTEIGTAEVTEPTKIINAKFIDEIRGYASELADRKRLEKDLPVFSDLSETDVIRGTTDMASGKVPSLSKKNVGVPYEIDVTTNDEKVSNDLAREKGKGSEWYTGAAKYPGISGNFSEVIRDKNTKKPKYIVIQEVDKSGNLGNFYAVDYEKNKLKLPTSFMKEIENEVVGGVSKTEETKNKKEIKDF